jgi:hypothetical protein
MQSLVLPDHDDGLEYDRLIYPFYVQPDAQHPGPVIGTADFDELPQPRPVARGPHGLAPPAFMFQCDNPGVPDDLTALEGTREVYVNMVILRRFDMRIFPAGHQ